MKFARPLALALLAAASGPAIAQAQYGAQPASPAPAPGAAAQAAPQIKLSPKAGPAIMALQTAVNANDVANIPAKAAEAKAVASTPDDRYAIAQLELKAAVTAKNFEAAAAAVEAISASGFASPAQVAQLADAIGIELFRAKKYDRAAAMFDKAVAAVPGNADYLVALAETRSAMGRNPEALQLMQKALSLPGAGGGKQPENNYKVAFMLAYGARSQQAVEFARQWVAAYPSAESWRNALAVYRNLNRLDVQGTLDLLRLMRATNALNTANDYILLAQAAAEQGNFGEAHAVMEEGLAAKKVNPADAAAADIINGLKSKPKPTAADLAQAAASAKTSTAKMAVGNRYYGLGDFAKAAELYRGALAAGADANLANLHIGMALARAGDKAGATAALKAVTGTYAPIAGYWLLFVNQRG